MRIKGGEVGKREARGEVEFAIKSSSHLQCGTSPLDPQTNQQSQIFRLLWKVRKVESDLTLEVGCSKEWALWWRRLFFWIPIVIIL